MDEEDYIEIETAILAKEVGYSNGSKSHFCHFHKEYIYDGDKDHPESYWKGEYRVYDDIHINNVKGFDNSNENYSLYERPTQAKLGKWLRVKFGIHIEMQLSRNENEEYEDWWFYLYSDIKKGGGRSKYFPGEDVPEGSSYEEAYEIGLREGLRKLKK